MVAEVRQRWFVQIDGVPWGSGKLGGAVNPGDVLWLDQGLIERERQFGSRQVMVRRVVVEGEHAILVTEEIHP